MTERADAQLAGDTLAERYDILELLGVGGMGAVYRARDRELDEIVALKVIRKELSAVPAMVERFRHEVKLARRVTHINVARTFELGISDGVMFCTMELIEGESLSKRLVARGRLPVPEAVAIACAMCDALTAAHAANVIHRDIKPDNVLLALDGRVVIADFGVASVGVSTTGELSGTPAYMAPEQARGEPPTPATDVYAVGVVLAEMVTGRVPFDGDVMKVLTDKQTIDHVAISASGDVTAELAAIVARATERELATRLDTANALRTALEPWLKGSRQSQPAIPPPVAARATAAHELVTVVVPAPVARAEATKHYLAEAVHEQLLARLARAPRLRVRSRRDDTDGDLVEVALEVGDSLDVRLTAPAGLPVALQFPLSVDLVHSTADSIAMAIDAAILHDKDRTRADATDMLLFARHIAHRDPSRFREVLDLLERAHVMSPRDPRIAANLATITVRTAFFLPNVAAGVGARARQLAYEAVTAAPDLADAHLAVGHVELNGGNPVLAATHFRYAIRCAPHLADAHEQLGRMLLETGYLDDALARLEEAIALAPELSSARWEITRALALDGRWVEHDRLVADLLIYSTDRPLSRARYAWWRGDWATLASLRAQIKIDPTVWPGTIDSLFASFLDEGGWARNKAQIVMATRTEVPNRRRRVFTAQLAAEAAAFAGDTETTIELIAYAMEFGLFDAHWMERCVVLDGVRGAPEFGALHAHIKQRADAIHDALYGDHMALSETAVV